MIINEAALALSLSEVRARDISTLDLAVETAIRTYLQATDPADNTPAPRPEREAQEAVADRPRPEDEAEQFIQAAIDSAPEPLRRLGEWLANKLDDDDWKTADRLITGAAVATSAVASELDQAIGVIESLNPDAAATIARLEKERDEAHTAFANGAYDAALKTETSIYHHALALTVEKFRAAEAEAARLTQERDEANERLGLAIMALPSGEVRSAGLEAGIRMLRAEAARLREAVKAKDEALRWYETEVSAIANALTASRSPDPDAVMAVVTVLSLDSGKRARAALDQPARDEVQG